MEQLLPEAATQRGCGYSRQESAGGAGQVSDRSVVRAVAGRDGARTGGADLGGWAPCGQAIGRVVAVMEAVRVTGRSQDWLHYRAKKASPLRGATGGWARAGAAESCGWVGDRVVGRPNGARVCRGDTGAGLWSQHWGSESDSARVSDGVSQWVVCDQCRRAGLVGWGSTAGASAEALSAGGRPMGVPRAAERAWRGEVAVPEGDAAPGATRRAAIGPSSPAADGSCWLGPASQLVEAG